MKTKDAYMTNEKLISEINIMIEARRKFQRRYKRINVSIQVTIAICGFLVAAASQNAFYSLIKNINVLLLILGLTSAICVIADQALKPLEKYLENKNIKRALLGLRDKLLYDSENWPDHVVAKYKTVCQTNPLVVIGKFEDIVIKT
jgi:hypothetical protein